MVFRAQKGMKESSLCKVVSSGSDFRSCNLVLCAQKGMRESTLGVDVLFGSHFVCSNMQEGIKESTLRVSYLAVILGSAICSYTQKGLRGSGASVCVDVSFGSHGGCQIRFFAGEGTHKMCCCTFRVNRHGCRHSIIAMSGPESHGHRRGRHFHGNRTLSVCL